MFGAAAIATLLAALAVWSAGWYVLAQQPRKRVNRSLFLLTVVLAVFYFAQFQAYLSVNRGLQAVALWPLVPLPLVYSATLQWMLSYRDEALGRSDRTLGTLVLLHLPATVQSVIRLLAIAGPGTAPLLTQGALPQALGLAISAAYVLCGFLVLFVGPFRHGDRVQRGQTGLVAVAPLLALGALVGEHFGANPRLLYAVPGAAIPASVFVAALVIGVSRFRLFLERPEDTARRVFTALADPVVRIDGSLRVFACNRRVEELSGYGESDLAGASIEMLLPDLDPERMRRDAERQSVVPSFSTSLRTRAGHLIPVVVTALPQPDRVNGGWDFVLKDISPQREAQESYRRLVETSLQGLVIIQDDAVAYANRAYAAMTGYHVNELYEMDPDEYFALIHPKDRDTVRSRFRRKLAQQPTPEQFAYRVYRKDETLRWFEVHVSRTTYRRRPALQAMVLDVTERKAAEERLAYLAYHDSLTGLENRKAFFLRLEEVVGRAGRQSSYRAALLVIDLDYFKNANDTYGHETGDDLLREVALRIRQSLRQNDHAYRLGGDEFAVILEDVVEPGDGGIVAEKIVHTVSLPFDINENRVRLGASVGITMITGEIRDTRALVEQADSAMYLAKEERNAFVFFSEELTSQARDRIALINDIRQELENGGFELRFQPVFDLERNPVSVEVLLRWAAERQPHYWPGEFIPVAESSRLIVPLGRWVMHQTFAAMARLTEQGLQIPVAINVSARQFLAPEFVDELVDSAQTRGIPLEMVILEVTEGLFLEPGALVNTTMKRLRKLGCRIALDDFGTGFSSLSYLKDLDVDIVKIDRSFVAGLGRDARSLSIVRGMMEIMRGLGQQVVAEGVETEVQLEAIVGLGADRLQGFLLSQPLTESELVGLLQAATGPLRSGAART